MNDSCPSSLKLSLFLVEGEYTKEEHSTIEAHLAGCAGCRQRLDELKSERETLYTQKPTIDLPNSNPPMWWRPVLVGSCACLLLAIGLWFTLAREKHHDDVQFKGQTPSLSFRVERQGRVIAGRSHMHLYPNDRIRFAYSVDEDAYLYIVNVDNDKRITPYYPIGTGKSAAIREGTEVFLPGSIRLDAYLGKERIFAVFSREPLKYETIALAIRQAFARVHAIEKIEALEIRGVQATILITKVKGHE